MEGFEPEVICESAYWAANSARSAVAAANAQAGFEGFDVTADHSPRSWRWSARNSGTERT
jgi:hypothetical protein